MERRRLYPRVRLYGGLYCPRRQVNDDSVIRYIEKAAKGGLSQTSTETSSESFEASQVKVMADVWPCEDRLGRFEFPEYMKRNVLEPKFCFGGGIFV